MTHRTQPSGRLVAILLLLAPLSVSHAQAQGSDGWGVRPRRTFRDVIQRVVSMPSDADLRSRTHRLGLDVVNVTWEDTGRFHGSAVGPNISDMTLQVREALPGGQLRTHLLPVLRHPNFSDRTADVPAEQLWVRVGNQREGSELHAVPLSEVLAHLPEYVTDPRSVVIPNGLLAERDTHFLVSAQHVFVPLPAAGKAEFNPVLFNYQSAPGNPAVLTLLITRQGTSATIIENRPGDQSLQGWGQQLFFNHAGQRTVFTAERRSAVAQRIQRGDATPQDVGALEEGADVMMVVQVPLRHRAAVRGLGFGGGEGAVMESSSAPAPTSARRSRGRSDVERAVIGHGDDLGPFRESNGQRLVRDERFPVRVTVQFYRATSNGVVSNADLREAQRQIEAVYEQGEFVGSLVVPEDERTRPTDWVRIRHGMRPRPARPAPRPYSAWVHPLHDGTDPIYVY